MEYDPVKLFISYSHQDEALVRRLINFLCPLVDNGLIIVWYDREIGPGCDWNKDIEDHIDSSDLMVYAVSAEFCCSEACKHELIRGLKLRDEVRTEVVPIILKNCGWKDVKAISEMQAIPKDGMAVASFAEESDGLMEVYENIKKSAEVIQRRKALVFSNETKKFLDEIGSLSALNFSGKDDVSFSDLFVYPDLMDQTSVSSARTYISGKDLVDKILSQDKIVISGESQSGKTALCKKLMYDLRERGFCPVLFTGKNAYEGNVARRIQEKVKQQYSDPESVRAETMVPILDDFYLAKDKENVLRQFGEYRRMVIIVDDVYSLDLSNSTQLAAYGEYLIEPLSAAKRGDLIANWIKIQERMTGEQDANFAQYDRLTRNVEQTLGKAIGKGVVPAYPFYVLSILATVEAAGRPLDSEITSQGYCYQVLLMLSLNKAGVDGPMLDTYVNLLTELGFWHFKEGDNITDESFDQFSKSYRNSFVLNVDDRDVIRRLSSAGIYSKNSYGYYSFTQRYLKYYFTARYISENFDRCNAEYSTIIANLGNSSNAYIAVFLAHHSKNVTHLRRVKDVVECQFKELEPCFLKEEDAEFLNRKVKSLMQVAFPDPRHTPTMERRAVLSAQDNRVEVKEELPANADRSIRELITTIRGTEVIGQIIKCRSGSVEKTELNAMMASVISAHGRLLRSFIDILKDVETQTEIVDWIVSVIKDKVRSSSNSDLKVRGERLFWQINYFTIFSIVNRCVQTVGSDKLVDEIDRICLGIESPMTSLIPIGVKLWFNKRVDVERICQCYDKLVGVSRWMLQKMVVRYCAMHKVDFKKKQFLAEKLDIKVR